MIERELGLLLFTQSAPQNWRELLDECHVSWVESPLHDKDINPDGTVKKPHWHIILLFDGNKSYDQIKRLQIALMLLYRRKLLIQRV